MGLHVGFGAFSGQAPLGSGTTVAECYREILDVARRAEALGFDSIWCSEHHGSPDGHLPSPLVLLAGIAAVTERIGLGTGITLGPFQHPLRFAEDCAVLDQLSNGRVLVGMASGWWDEEFRMFGIPMAERASRTAELATICRAAWDQEQFSFRGRHWLFENVRVTPKPAGPLPLFMGGTAQAAIERAGRLADGFTGTSTPQCGVETFKTHVNIFDSTLIALGRDPKAVPIGFHTNLWVSPDGLTPPWVFEAMWNQIGMYVAWHAGDEPTTVDGIPPLDEKSLRMRAFLGRPEEVIEQVRPWLTAFPGRDLHIIFRLHYPGMTADQVVPAMELFAQQVMPALRELAS